MIKRKNIGPSCYSTVLGLNKFKTCEELQHEIEVGYNANDQKPNSAMNMGISKEAEVIKLYENVKNVKVKSANWVRLSTTNNNNNNTDRILGKADGLVNLDGGVEIKCHYGKQKPLCSVPLYHLVQILGYLHLYKREWWDLVSCCFNEKGELGEYRIHRIYWKDYSRPWLEFWFPQIEIFIKSIKW